MSAVARDFFERSTGESLPNGDAPILLDAPGEAVNRVRRVDLLRAAIDRRNLAGTVGVSLAWRRENLPPRPISALGSLTTFRLALKVNLRTPSRKIRHNRSFFFALGRENGRRGWARRAAFDDLDLALEPATEPVSETDRVIEPTVVVPVTRTAAQPPPAQPADRIGRPVGTSSGDPGAAPEVDVTRRTSELDELMRAMELTQRTEPVSPPAITQPDPEPEPALPPAGWYPDPTGHAELRYWDRRWTAHVTTNGRLAIVPLDHAGPGGTAQT